uniref:Pectinesterase inhibitor domain-containing protein n=1 Tax=Solanum tuberosum TaxID=4113 RepID=M1E0U0_SOLTU
MDCLRSSLVVVTLLLFLSFQIKADTDIHAIISILKLGEANATATLEYLSEGNPKNASAENRASCFKWYEVTSLDLYHSIDHFKKKNIREAVDGVGVANAFISTCIEFQIEDATILSSYHYIKDICKKVLEQFRDLL